MINFAKDYWWILLMIVLIVLIFFLNRNEYKFIKNKNDLIRYNHWNNEFKLWKNKKDRESSSGSGSTLYNTRNTIKTIGYIIDKYNIKTILDLPCGDTNWITKINMNNIQYMGLDISPEIIKYNKEKYNHLNFKIHDIVEYPIYDKYDLIICRDLLFHLNIEEVINSINNFKKSNSTYILTTTFPNSNDNSKLSTNGFSEINLNIEPFNFQAPIELFPEIEKGKYLGLWKLDTINL